MSQPDATGRHCSTLRTGIICSLNAGAALTFALAVLLILWAALAGLGDVSGARVAGGIAWGLAIGWSVDLVALVVLTALAHLAAAGMEEDEG